MDAEPTTVEHPPDYRQLRDVALQRIQARKAIRDANCQDDVDRAQRQLRDADDKLADLLEPDE